MCPSGPPSEGREQPLCDRIKSILENRTVFLVLLTLICLYVVSHIYIDKPWGDLRNYYVNAGDVLDGKMPYSEAKFEYPPLALIFMLIPRILSWSPVSFYSLCMIEAFIFILIGAYFLSKISDKLIGSRWQMHLLLLMLPMFSIDLLFVRNDVIPTVFAIISIWLYIQNKYVPAFIILAVAAMIKMYPAVLFLAMIAPFVAGRDWKNLTKGFVAVAVTCLIIELPFLIKDPSTAFAYLTYHSDRGIQIESVVSSIIMVAHLIAGVDASVDSSYGCQNIHGHVADSLSPYMNMALGIFLVAFAVAMVIKIARSERAKEHATEMVCAMSFAFVMLFILFSKVYSAQYLIWILMLFPLTQMRSFSWSRKIELICVAILLGIFSLLSYRMYWKGLTDLQPLSVSLTFMKNIFHILLTLEAVHLCFRECHDEPDDGHGLIGGIVKRTKPVSEQSSHSARYRTVCLFLFLSYVLQSMRTMPRYSIAPVDDTIVFIDMEPTMGST